MFVCLFVSLFLCQPGLLIRRTLKLHTYIWMKLDLFQTSTRACGLHEVTIGGAGQTDKAGGARAELSHGHLPRHSGTSNTSHMNILNFR